MKDKEINKDFELPEVLKQQKGKNAFSTPDNYFDNLSNNLSNIPSSYPVSPLQSFIKTATFKYIAAAVITSAVITGAIIINKNNIKDNTSENTEIVENVENKSEVEFNKQQNNTINNQKEIRNITTDDLNKKPSSASENIVTENKSTNSPKDNNTNKTPSKPETKITNEDINKSDSYDGNNAIIAENNYPNSNNDGLQVTESPAAAKIQSNTTVVKDTCVLDSCILSPKSRIPDAKLFYKWSNGEMSRKITVYESGKYWVKISNERTFENSVTDTFNIKIVPSPEIDLGKDRIICKFESLKLESNVLNDDYNYYWNINESEESSIHLKDLYEGRYSIVLSIKACDKIFRDQLTLNVNNCSLNIPNVITPNNDGSNDYFVIDGLEHYSSASLIIMDRNGKQVFQSNNYQNNWDGENLPEGTYFYVLRLKNKEITEKGGIITIVR